MLGTVTRSGGWLVLPLAAAGAADPEALAAVVPPQSAGE